MRLFNKTQEHFMRLFKKNKTQEHFMCLFNKTLEHHPEKKKKNKKKNANQGLFYSDPEQM